MVSSLRIGAVMLHGIKKSTREGGVEPDLSEDETLISGQVRGFLQEQLSNALRDGRQIIEEGSLSTVPGLIRTYWAGDRSLLDTSQDLARTLQASQPVVSPEGLLMVAEATVDGDRGFIVAKLEHEKGTQAVREPNSQGALVYSMTFLDNLFFTEGSKVFKIGYFPFSADEDHTLEGLVVDKQAPGHTVAQYFRESYLGCVWKERPELATERFMDTVQAYINTVEDPAKRSKYQLALITELQSQKTGLSVSSFASEHIEIADRDEFKRHAERSLPTATITKDLNLVHARLANVRWDTESGTVVIATPESVTEGKVQVEAKSDGRTEIRVTDRLAGTSSTGKYRGPFT